MIIYLIRHGKSEGNLSGVHQDAQSPLSEKGLEQANLVAKRFETIPIDMIISSPMTRAMQTAEIISKATNKQVEVNNLLSEIKRPSEVVGKVHDHPDVVKIKTVLDDNWHKKDYHFSDEENFFDFRDRTLMTLDYLASLHKERVLVVTHGIFLRMLIATMFFGDRLRAWQFEMMNMPSDNTGITVIQYEEEKKKWYLLTFNDRAHFGGI